MWTTWSYTKELSFTLQRASSIESEQGLAQTGINYSLTQDHPTIPTALYVSGVIAQTTVRILIDLGAAMSIVCLTTVPESFHSCIKSSQVLATSASGHSLDVIGQVTLPVTVGTAPPLKHSFMVVRNLTVECLLGADFLMMHQAVVNCAKGCLSLTSEDIPFINSKTSDKLPAAAQSDASNTEVCHITVLHPVDVQGRSVQFITAQLRCTHDSRKSVLPSTEGLVEPATHPSMPKHLMLARSLNTVDDAQCIHVQIVNVSHTPITLCKGTPLGMFIPICNVLVVDDKTTCATPTKQPPLSIPDIDLSSANLSTQEKSILRDLLNSFSEVFSSSDRPLGHTSIVQHEITTTRPPIRQPMRRLPVILQETVNKEVNQMLQSGVIRPSNSPWSSPVVMVKKKDNSWRFCIDYCKLNAVTRRDAYPLPRIDSTLNALSNSSLFTTLDLTSGYWQVEMAEQDKGKTAFSSPQGHFEFNVMPFGLTNAPATFQRLRECVLAGLSGESCLIYLDDIIIFSSSFDDHLVRLTAVLQRLQQAGLVLKPSKCQFAMKQVTYLGHVVSKDGVQPDPAKLSAVANFPIPTDAKHLKQFLGLANYYRRFIRDYAAIAEPLHRVLRGKQSNFTWDGHCTMAFANLKNRLISPPILSLPDFRLPFVLHTDASGVAVGGVLGQICNGAEKVVAYWSRQLKPSERNYSTLEREALAAVSAVKEFYPYLYGHPFTLVTDHNPLTLLKSLNDFGGRLTRWTLFLQQFDFKFQYRQGKRHINADSLSRRPPDTSINSVTEFHQLGDYDRLHTAQDEDPHLRPLITSLREGNTLSGCPIGLRKCFLKDGVLCRYYKPSNNSTPYIQVVVPTSLRPEVLQHLHNQSGHFGIKRTTLNVKTRFYWPGYEYEIAQWVQNCQECQKRQTPVPHPQAPLGTLQAQHPFEKLSWDIMGPLPKSDRGNQYILVVTDIFTKWVEAFPLSNTLSLTLATALVDEVICRYGVPTYIHSDQGANLCSEVIQTLCKLLGIQTTRTSAYHPQGNGQVERFNRTVEAILAKTVKANQRNWDCQLQKALFAYRVSIHESTGFSPYQLNFGSTAELPIDVFLSRSRVAGSAIKNYPDFVRQTHRQLKESMGSARQLIQQQHRRHKEYYDKNCRGGDP